MNKLIHRRRRKKKKQTSPFLLDYAQAQCNNYSELEAIRNHSIVVQETTIKEEARER